MLKTQDFVGKKVVLALINSNRDEGYQAKLLGVESGGVWVDCDELLGSAPKSATKVPLFVPYSQIHFLMPLPPL